MQHLTYENLAIAFDKGRRIDPGLARRKHGLIGIFVRTRLQAHLFSQQPFITRNRVGLHQL
jgi:hypothetical protein